MNRDAAELIPTRASLLERLKEWQDQSSWQQFFDTYWPLIYGVARRADLTDAEAQDVVQETMVATAKHLPTFQYDPAIGSFKAWLLTLTRWRIIDQIRKRGPLGARRHWKDTGNAAGTDTIAKVADPSCPSIDEMWEKEWQANLMDAAQTNVKRRLAPQQYQIFDCYVNKNWAPKRVADALGISVGLVYIAKHRVTELLKAEVRRLEKQMI